MTVLRRCIELLAVTALLGATAGWAQPYPSKTVHYLSGASTASGADTLGRLMAAGLSQTFGQQVVVDNRPGAGGNIVAEAAAKAPADGYTMLQATAAYAVYANMYRNLSYDLIRDFAPVTELAVGPYVVVVHPSLPVKSIPELIKLAKAKPGAISYASAGAGGPTFMAAELFKAQAGVDMLHVPYKGGGPALNGVVSGEVSLHFAPVATAVSNIQGGRLRALAVTADKRISMLPDLPTIADAGLPGYESVNWYGLLVPAKTPRAVIDTIRTAAISVLNNPTMSKRLNDLGFVVLVNQPEEFAAYIKLEVERMGKIVKAFNLKPE